MEVEQKTVEEIGIQTDVKTEESPGICHQVGCQTESTGEEILEKSVMKTPGKQQCTCGLRQKVCCYYVFLKKIK